MAQEHVCVAREPNLTQAKPKPSQAKHGQPAARLPVGDRMVLGLGEACVVVVGGAPDLASVVEEAGDGSEVREEERGVLQARLGDHAGRCSHEPRRSAVLHLHRRCPVGGLRCFAAITVLVVLVRGGREVKVARDEFVKKEMLL